MAAKLGSTDVSFRLGATTPAAVYLGAVPVWTAVPTFTGAVSGDWAEPGNWVGGELPAAADNAIVTATVSSNSGEDSPTVANLTVSSGGFVILITVTGTATFSNAFLSGTIVGNAAFGNGSATTGGSSVTGNATFNGGSSHGGSVTGTATFTGDACNNGGTAGTFVPDPPPSC